MATMESIEKLRLKELLCDRFMLAQELSGLNKSRFAEAVGLTPPKLTNIANHRNHPPHAAILQAAAFIGNLDVNWFYGGPLPRDQSVEFMNKMATALKKRQPARAA
jgi:hypothetical protein